MTNKWKIFVPVGIVALAIIAVVIYSQLGKEVPQYATEEDVEEQQVEEQQQVAVVTVPATGNVDDAINALLKEAAADQAAFSSEESDASLLVADSQAISDFGQSYDESEF